MNANISFTILDAWTILELYTYILYLLGRTIHSLLYFPHCRFALCLPAAMILDRLSSLVGVSIVGNPLLTYVFGMK